MAKFRKKPVVIEARRITLNNTSEIVDWILDNSGAAFVEMRGRLPTVRVDTLEGIMMGEVGDWIIQGVANEFYPCKPEIFRATYEVVED